MAARSLESLMDNLGESFTTRLLQLIDERGLKDSTVYKQSNISRQHFSKIQCNREYNPRLFRHVFTPILDRYGVLQQDRPYIMAFYIRGLMAIISEWLKNDCADSITYVTGVIQQCVKMPQSETSNAV